VRMDRWKGIRIPMFEGPIELYDLENDPGETIDLSIQYPDIVKEIEAIMSRAHTLSPIWN